MCGVTCRVNHQAPIMPPGSIISDDDYKDQFYGRSDSLPATTALHYFLQGATRSELSDIFHCSSQSCADSMVSLDGFPNLEWKTDALFPSENSNAVIIKTETPVVSRLIRPRRHGSLVRSISLLSKILSESENEFITTTTSSRPPPNKRRKTASFAFSSSRKRPKPAHNQMP